MVACGSVLLFLRILDYFDGSVMVACGSVLSFFKKQYFERVSVFQNQFLKTSRTIRQWYELLGEIESFSTLKLSYLSPFYTKLVKASVFW